MLTKVSKLLHFNAKTPQLSVTADDDKKRPSVKSQRKNTHVQAVGWWKTTLEARFRQETSTLNEHIGRKDIPKCETHGPMTCHGHFAICVPCGLRPAESTEPADLRGVMPNDKRKNGLLAMCALDVRKSVNQLLHGTNTQLFFELSHTETG